LLITHYFSFYLDSEFVVNNALSPLPVTTVNLPPGYTRVHLITTNFRDKLINQDAYGGQIELIRRLLKPSGAVVTVYLNDMQIQSRVDKTYRLKKLIHQEIS